MIVGKSAERPGRFVLGVAAASVAIGLHRFALSREDRGVLRRPPDVTRIEFRRTAEAGRARTGKLARSRVPLVIGLTVAGISAVIIVLVGQGGSHAAAPVLPAAGTPVAGKAYSFWLLIHRGVPVVSFGGRAWRPVRPVPVYPGARPVNGITTETGYATGTMTLVNGQTLRFVADVHAVRAPFVVLFKPAAVPSQAPPCA